MKTFSTAVIGGGAAGIVAAITAASAGERVVICDKMPQLGKKILASGNGRCNLLNKDLSEEHYNPAARSLVRSVFERAGLSVMTDFFKKLGLELCEREGRIFPRTNQASSVMRVLEIEIARLGIPLELGFDAVAIEAQAGGLRITSKSGAAIACRVAIIACGGRTYPAYGSDGSFYRVLERRGHTIVDPVPSAVPLVVKDQLCHFLQGQRMPARVRSLIDGKVASESDGELLFAQYGLSGTCILDVSEEISIAINRDHKKDVAVSIDLAPFMSLPELTDEIARRMRGGSAGEDMLVGILPNKCSRALAAFGKGKAARDVAAAIKEKKFTVLGTRGWNEAEFTSGGVSLKEVDEHSLGSKVQKGLYFAGEVLDVDGKRGGYNLAWAWASGMIAGRAR
ncbi:MAG: aminoacetone oxidase family FAD-binding enzyme [Candidatus Omnitrophota bacterium]